MTTPYCLICHNIYVQTEAIDSTPCGHVYHSECLAQWLNTSQTCPQCRKDCAHCQTQRIYIDFACDEDLACAQISKDCNNSNTDAEETIKLLLEHIEKGPENPQETPECEFCKEFQEAFNNAVMEKDLMAQTMGSVESENVNLMEKHQRAMKVIEKLNLEVRESDENLRDLQEQQETSEKCLAAIQSENLFKQDIINDLETTISKLEMELKNFQAQLQKLNDKLKQMTEVAVKHAAEINLVHSALVNITRGHCQRRLIKRYRNRSPKIVPNEKYETNECRAIVPYCGDIDCWDFMVIPIINKSHYK